MPGKFSTQQVADLFGAKRWQVARVFEKGEVPEPPRFAGRRLIDRSLLGQIAAALDSHGWLPPAEAAQ